MVLKWISISPFDEEKWIEISYEFSTFFGDWHTHYFSYDEEFKVFLDDLTGILHNGKFTVCAYDGGKWFGSYLSEGGTRDLSQVRDIFGDKKHIVCGFWNK